MIGDSSAFYLLSAGLFIWIILASLDLIISGARYFINKPYIREIIVEVEKEIEAEPKPVKDKKPKQKEPKKPQAKEPEE